MTEAEEARRLEELWAGDFGDAYTARNQAAGEARAPFWRSLLTEFGVGSALEIGCNVGANLRWIEGSAVHAYGIDVNQQALETLLKRVPGVRPGLATAKALPFADGSFDLVFTMGVLIHQPESSLGLVLDEIVRCSRRYVLCGEYFAAQTVEIPYRGQTGALFKRDYGRLFVERHPRLKLIRQQFLARDQGWDDITAWLFETS